MSEIESGEETVGEAGEARSVDERVELALELLAHIEADSMPLSEVMKRIESVTTVAATQREILTAAEERGLLVRDRERHVTRGGKRVSETGAGSSVHLTGEKSVGEADIERRDGDYTCQRCGASLSTGHFVAFDEREHGAFGPECVRIVLGRD